MVCSAPPQRRRRLLNTRLRNTLLFVFKLLVTAACLWWLSRYVDLAAIGQSLAGFSPGILLAGVALHLACYLAGAVRWWYLFRYLAGPVRFSQILPSYYLGVFFNNFLPTAYGGDLARSARLYVSGMSGNALVGSAVMDRLLGLAAVVAIGSLALLFSDVAPFGHLAWTVFGGGALGLLLAAALMALPDWSRALDSRYGRRWPRLGALLAGFLQYRKAPQLMLKAFALSVLNQLLVVAVFILLAREAGLGVTAWQLVTLLMLVFLVASLPVSLGGLGPREGALLALLLPFGVEAPAVLAVSIAYLAVLWASALPGLFMLFLRVDRPAGAPNETAPPG
jgi:uncharacterized membrane protein YbhN (UPF0104 family)